MTFSVLRAIFDECKSHLTPDGRTYWYCVREKENYVTFGASGALAELRGFVTQSETISWASEIAKETLIRTNICKPANAEIFKRSCIQVYNYLSGGSPSLWFGTGAGVAVHLLGFGDDVCDAAQIAVGLAMRVSQTVTPFLLASTAASFAGSVFGGFGARQIVQVVSSVAKAMGQFTPVRI